MDKIVSWVHPVFLRSSPHSFCGISSRLCSQSSEIVDFEFQPCKSRQEVVNGGRFAEDHDLRRFIVSPKV